MVLEEAQRAYPWHIHDPSVPMDMLQGPAHRAAVRDNHVLATKSLTSPHELGICTFSVPLDVKFYDSETGERDAEMRMR